MNEWNDKEKKIQQRQQNKLIELIFLHKKKYEEKESVVTYRNM